MAGKKEAAKMAKKSVDAKLGQQALGPAAKQFGQALAPLGTDAGEVATLVGTRLLGTVRGLVHGYDVVSVWLHEAVTRRLKEVSRDKIAEPNPRVTVPAVQALTYSMK